MALRAIGVGGLATTSLPAGVPPAEISGYKCVNFDPVIVAAGTVVPAAGRLYLQRHYTPAAISATKLVVEVITAGATLTAGQNFACLYRSTGQLIGVTADQATAWATVATCSMTLTGGPRTIPAGYFYTGFWCNGTTLPAFGRGGTTGKALIYGNSTAATARWAYGTASGLTTTAPATLPALTLDSRAYWVGVQ